MAKSSDFGRGRRATEEDEYGLTKSGREANKASSHADKLTQKADRTDSPDDHEAARAAHKEAAALHKEAARVAAKGGNFDMEIDHDGLVDEHLSLAQKHGEDIKGLRQEHREAKRQSEHADKLALKAYARGKGAKTEASHWKAQERHWDAATEHEHAAEAMKDIRDKARAKEHMKKARELERQGELHGRAAVQIGEKGGKFIITKSGLKRYVGK